MLGYRSTHAGPPTSTTMYVFVFNSVKHADVSSATFQLALFLNGSTPLQEAVTGIPC